MAVEVNHYAPADRDHFIAYSEQKPRENLFDANIVRPSAIITSQKIAEIWLRVEGKNDTGFHSKGDLVDQRRDYQMDATVNVYHIGTEFPQAA